MTMLFRYKIDISYLGKNFYGWQSQLHGNTVQDHIQKALTLLLKEPVKIVGAGRTDTKVHAIEQVAHFDSHQNISNSSAFLYSLNSLLTPDIRVMNISTASPLFHARFSATAKMYRYIICQNKNLFPFFRHLYFFPTYFLDTSQFQKARKYFLGNQDFTSFANMRSKGNIQANPIKTIYSFEILEKNAFIIFEIQGNSFLYKMVRNIVGCFLALATKKTTLNQIPEIFQKKDRTKAFKPAPAQGLYLVRVSYPKEFCLSQEKKQTSIVSFTDF